MALGIVVAAVWALLLLGVNTPLADQAGLYVPLLLVLGAVVVFGLGGMLGNDFTAIRSLELEVSRTVAVHGGVGQLPTSDTAIGRVLAEYVSTVDELRARARTHAYAAGPAAWGAAAALAAAVFWGLGSTTGAIWLVYLAVVTELPTVVLLSFSVGLLASGVGQRRAVEGFAVLTPRRWKHFERESPALREAISVLPWLAESRGFDRPVPVLVPPAAAGANWNEAQA